MPQHTDQLNRTIELPANPQRIVSLVPSQTELLHYLGLGDRVVGITKFCIHPEEWYRSKPRVGGTKKYHFDRIEALQPDLIIGNKEENEQEQIEQLMERYPVWMSDIFDLPDALNMIEAIGRLCSREEKAAELRSEIEHRFAQLQPLAQPLRTAYFIWRKPWMLAGGNTFINTMLQRMGLQNCFADQESRYPEVSEEALAAANPQVLLLSSEPYPFKEQHIAELRAMCPTAEIRLVDGELFSWYGNRLLHTASYLSALAQDLSTAIASR